MHGGISTVEQWIDNLFPSASDVIAGIVLRNSLCPTMPQGHRVIDFPVILLSDPSTSERANSAVTFLESCGFSDVRFVHPFTRAGDIDLQQLMANGAIDDAGLMQLQWSAKENWLLSLSVILNHMAAIRLGIESGSPYFGVFEDDLMLGCGVEAARAKLLDAILELPPDADMLYLEYCLETCSRLSFRAHRRRIVPAHRPLCCAAVVFTAAGARRALARMVPAFDGIDYIYSDLIAARRLSAFLAAPPVFFQDGFWASTVRPAGPRPVPGSRAAPGRTHRPFGLLCRELAADPAMRLTVVQELPPPSPAAPGGLACSDGLADYDWLPLPPLAPAGAGGGRNGSDADARRLELLYLSRPAVPSGAGDECGHGGDGGDYSLVMARGDTTRAAEPVVLWPPPGSCCARGPARCVVNVSLVSCPGGPPAPAAPGGPQPEPGLDGEADLGRAGPGRAGAGRVRGDCVDAGAPAGAHGPPPARGRPRLGPAGLPARAPDLRHGDVIREGRAGNSLRPVPSCGPWL